MKIEHPLLITIALISAVLVTALALFFVSSPETEIVAPAEEMLHEEQRVEGEGEVPSVEGAGELGAQGLSAVVSGRTVTIKGPEAVEAKIASCVVSVGWFGPGGNGLWIEWGDGSTAPTFEEAREGESCSDEVRSHTFAAAGTYNVRVRLWHPGPADEPVTDWEDTVTVTVK